MMMLISSQTRSRRGGKRQFALKWHKENRSWPKSYNSMKLYNNYRFIQYHRPQHNNMKRHNDPLRRNKESK
jgi:hypothetical protein